MADLGNLYFDILFRDKTAEQRKKLKAEITKDLQAKLDVGFDKKKLVGDMKTLLQSEKFKINVVVDKASTTQAVRAALQAAGLNTNFTASDLRAAKAAAIQTKAEASAAAARELARQRAARAAKAELDLANARERSANAARRHMTATLNMNGAMNSQLSIVGQLRNEFLGLYSIYAAQNFLRAVVDIGGELENQKIAMASILQDEGKATTIFNQIKKLAVASPFGVMDLNQYAKQLSAYSIPYNELYDTMKRLADISAGVGVDMGRIILAYGQIKAAKFLKGTELRQLTEANIPMVDKLAERFSKLEGRIVSAGEVLDMISKKKVTFEDVKDVLWELTDDGGMFNNMQEVLSESVKSKWKNLADAIDIMLGDIAESTGSTLKWTAESLITLAQNWKEVVPFITAATAAFGTYRVAVYAGSRAMGVANATLIKGTLAAKQKTAADLVMASNYRTLTAAEKGLIASRNAMTTAEWRALAVSGALNKEQALRLITLGKIKSGQAGHITQLLNISKAELQVAMSAGKARVAMAMLSYGAKQVWTAFKGLFNPYMYLFAGLFAITELWYKSGQKADEMNERISELTTRAQDGFKNLTKEAQKFADVDPFKANDASLISSIEEMKTALKDYSPVWADTFNETFKTDDEGNTVKSLAEQYILLRNALNDTKEAYRLLNAIRGTSEYANDATDGYFDESFSENIEDYIKTEKQIDKIIDRMAGSYIEYYTAMQKVIAKYDDFAKVASGKSLKEQLDIIKEYPKALASLNNELPFTGGYRDDIFQLRKAWKNSKRVFEEEVSPDMQSFISEYKSRLQAAGWNLDNLSDAQKIAIGLDISSFLDQFKEMPVDIRNFLNGEILEKQFNIKINAEYTETIQSLSDLQKKFNEATDGQFEAQIKVSTDSEKIIEGIQKAYKEAKETTNQLKPILIKAGIDLSEINYPDISELPELMGNVDASKLFDLSIPIAFPKVFDSSKLLDWQKQIVSDYKKASDIMQAGEKGAKKIGFSLTDPNKDKSKKDAFAERLKERVNLLKEAYSEYKKWTDIVGKGEAASKVKESGIFDSLFKGKEPVDIGNYRDELNKILNQLDDKTKERRELKVSIRKVLFDIDANAMKEASDKAAKELERYVSDVSKKWDIYKQLVNAGASKKDASTYAFGFLTDYENEAQYLIDTVQKKLKEKAVDLPFTLSDDEAESILGGKDSPLYKQFFKVWKDAKEAFEKDKVSIALDDTKVIANARSTIEKIRILSEQYASKTGLSVGKNGELVGDTSGLNNVQKAYLDEYNKKLIELKSTLLQLLPEWEKIFGDKEQRSFSDLKEAERIAREIKNNAKVSYDSDGKPNGFTSFFTKDDGSIENVKGAYSLLDKLIKAIPQLQDAQLAVNPFKTLAKNVKELFTSEKDSDKLEKKIGRLGESAAESADLVGNFAGQMSSMFDALGNEGMADTMGNVQDAMSSISNIGQGFAKGGIVGGIAAAAGEAVNWIGKIAQAHDKKLDKAIEKSKLRAQQLQYIYEQIDGILERFLGSGTELKLVDAENDRTRLNQLNNQIEAIRNKGKINIFDLMSLQKYKQEAEKLQKRVSAYDEGGAYGYQRALMQEQLSELEKQRQAEIDKKKTDDSKVADYENQIAEMKQQIKDFAEETAESLYGINLKDWASQLGDALYEAWQKGEDGAEAFKNKVADIMGDVMNSILKISILEPAMQQLQKMLFGEDGMSGYFGKDFSLDEKELESIADYLMGVSEKTDDYYSMLDKLNNYMEKKYGISMKEEEEDSGSGLSKGIQNVTENTANLLASYINAIRADVSVKREYVRRLVEELFPAYNVIAQAQLQQLTMIQINTAKNVEFVEEIRDILHRNINGVNKFNI
ncbi:MULTISPECIES: replicative DNA helicase [Bacteroides]|uniref:replicative DNA helicase n=3 Tax=Bacteroidaceae TaxID=815 RepID=UPI0018985676|nr:MULTISPECIES: replicative DNA helicase [Bacteroides]MDB1078410.1 replicative DNA helicase [Phocaeicola vulgatus]MDC1842328.1 replicative DNA helicase [Bacteroides uniformis]MDC1850294.1 replicative DNA helicase [Bacteroides uniformis]MDC2171285.1 replicative DNA helicase [Bacteroides thetaiotaomicron]MDC2186724.1 replicative DNA helicase [Bacteroides thetaiotaomicron]